MSEKIKRKILKYLQRLGRKKYEYPFIIAQKLDLPFDEVMQAIRELEKDGKIKYRG